MPYPELSVNYGLALKVETNQGTYATPTMAADAIPLAEEPTIEVGYILPGAREGLAVGGYGAPPNANPLGRYGRIRFRTELLGSGTAATPPRWARLLQPFAPEVIATDVSYQPGYSTPKCLSAILELGGKQFQLVGAVPEQLTIRGDATEARVFVEGTLAGKLNAAPTEQALEAQTFQDTNPVPFQGALTVGGTVIKYAEFVLDFGLASLPWRVERNTADPLIFGVVTNVHPKLTFPGEVEALATHDPFTRQSAQQTALALSQTLGTTSGRKYVITADHLAVAAGEALGFQAKDGILYYGLTLEVKRPATGTFLKLSHA